MINKITLQQVEYLSFQLAKETMAFNEPIPDFGTRYPQVLERCLATPFQTFLKKPLYKGLVAKASILFYILIKDHPFQNGNKRIALTTLLLFLHLNKKWLNIDQQELYNFTMWVASSPRTAKDQVIEASENLIKKHLKDM